MLQYEELRIRVRPIDASHCLVAVSGPVCALGVIAVNGEPAAFRARWDRLVAADLGHAPMGERHTAEQLRDLGRDVYGLLFGGGDGGGGGSLGASAASDAECGLGAERGLRTAYGPGTECGLGTADHLDAAGSLGTDGDRLDADGAARRAGGTGACLAHALDFAQRLRPPRALRLRFDLPPGLRELPLEALCAPAGLPQQSLALGPAYSLARSLPGGPLGRRLPDPADQPSLIRLLVACASPSGAGRALRVDTELAALRQELPDVAVRTTVLERATRERLESALGAHGDLPTAVLLIAHGTYDEDLGKGVVRLETEDGGVDPVPADLLSGILLKAPRLRLVVLNLCSGADSSGPDGVHAEPFSGLAQALIGGGVPAVVAMRGRVSDVSAGRFSPELLKGLAANRTIDESMAAARRRISHLPQHTAVEWATPALFLHEGYRHGWLFKAREVRDDDGAVADPLRSGADALRAYHNPIGHVGTATLIDAARFERDRGGWRHVQQILRTQTQTRSYEDEQRQLRDEAAFELAWPKLERLCGLLAAGRDGVEAAGAGGTARAAGAGAAAAHSATPGAAAPELAADHSATPGAAAAGTPELGSAAADATAPGSAARPAVANTVAWRAAAAADAAAALEAVRQALPAHPLPAALTDRVDRLRRTAELAERARAAEAAADWPAAIALYEQLVVAAPDSPAARTRLTAARAELRLTTTLATATRAHHQSDWPTAAQAYAEALSLRPGDPPLASRAAYARGRIAESADDWRGAVAAFGECADATPSQSAYADISDAALRCAYAGGRVAADEGDWATAVTAFGACREAVAGGGAGAGHPSDEGWAEGAPAGAGRAGSNGNPPERNEAGPDSRDSSLQPRTAAAAHPAPTPRTPYGDVTLRWAYAQARLCQERSDWGGAVAHLAALPAKFADVPVQLLYAQGMFADARGDWEGVIDGFGGLPDEYAGGEVKVRRLYARARSAADGRGDWTAVSALLADLPDTARDGTVAPLRRKAEGRRAEAGGDWATACAVYARAFTGGTVLPPSTASIASTTTGTRQAPAGASAPDGATPADSPHTPATHLTPTTPEPLHLHLYALARTHELACRWDDALRLFLVLPDGWADVAVRRRYARARVAEQGAEGARDWRDVADAYDALAGKDVPPGKGSASGKDTSPREIDPPGRGTPPQSDAPPGNGDPGRESDCALRARYARIRAAEADAEWTVVAGAAEALGTYRDAPALAAYARGRLADAHQEWPRAAEAFRKCPGHRDSAAHLAYAEGRLLEAEGRWAEAVGAYERAAGRLDRADVRRRRLRRLIDLLPWADGPTHAPLAADPFALRDETYPYRALRTAGVHPGVSMAAVSDASYTLLERGRMSWSERVAWDRLRLPGRRLQVDALLYRWRDPDGLRAELAGLSQDDEHAGPAFVDVLCERFPDDAPLLLLLARGRDAATAEWARRLAAAPGDMAVAHGLAVARLWQAQELEQSGAWEHAVRAWQSALAHWATLLSDDVYWDGWRAERAACYERELTHEDMTRLRWELSRHLFALLSTYEQRHTEQGRPQQAAMYEVLGELLEGELAGARVLNDVGGLPGVPGARTTLACGPRYVRLLDLQLPLAELAADLDAAAKDGKDPGEYAVRELRWAFSELSRSLVLCAVHKFEPALRALPAFPTLTTLPADCAGPAAPPEPARAHHSKAPPPERPGRAPGDR
ncbi:CHAT domain-containing protein, partial [Streptomyces lasiicapitis]|uniref:CHAT domain-containing protein n=1 Tax=Streptomyces lasiicapitis TaxID=1923961 RepID=UPI0036481C71